MTDPLRHLTAGEAGAVLRYVEVLSEILGDELVEVRLFGSAARGDLWPAWSSMRSDIDLLVLTRDAPGPDARPRPFALTAGVPGGILESRFRDGRDR